MQTVIRVEKLSKTFHHNKALHAVDLTVQQGEMVALLGPSGSGKSTLLRHLSGLITCDKTPESRVELLGNTVQHAGRLASDIRKSRAQTGYIFQQFNLVNRLTVLENVLIGALGSTPFWRTCLRWFSPSQKQEALQALTRVGMAHFAHQRVSTLSGGQQQRVAIARALMQKAKIILADEPIASLDRVRPHRDGNPARHQPERRHHRGGDAASGGLRPALLRAHRRPASGPCVLRWRKPPV